ncbi:porin [Paraburkholderia sp. J63]|uniref:porin n=1 Tax=Paraburkholderia sp. J63 TaxID=2805434 RepID=UPI002ABE61A8|nr:porin [Paraburkholderia sp. J63]
MKYSTSLALACLLASGSACAQSSVQIYGLIDAGLSWVSNEGGHSNFKFADGIYTPTLFGLLGSEDLGGGTKAVFRLESQYQIGGGNILPGEGLFGREAYVGLQDTHYGSLTLGNQFDFMFESLARAHNDPAFFSGGLYAFRAGPFTGLDIPNNPTGGFDWDRLAGEQVHNSLKYQSPTWAGVRVGAMYAFGGVPGQFSAGSAVSFGVNYDHGPFGMGGAYTEVRYAGATPVDPLVPVRNWGVGAHYDFGKVIAAALFTTVRNRFNGAAVYAAEAGASWTITPAWTLAGNYTYMKGNDTVSNAHANQLAATFSYSLSKRTLVYVQGIYQRANSGADALICGVVDADAASSSPTQAIARAGIQTSF